MSLVEYCGSNCSLDQRRRLFTVFTRNDQIHIDPFHSSLILIVIRSHYMAYVNHLLHCWGPWGLRLVVSSSLPSFQVKISSISKTISYILNECQ